EIVRFGPKQSDMKAPAVLQRVKSACISIDEHAAFSIGEGLLVLLRIQKDSTKNDADSMVTRILNARLWPGLNSNNVSNRSLISCQGDKHSGHKGGSAMWYVTAIRPHLLCFSRQVVPQFLLRGREGETTPEKVDEAAHQLYDYFIEQLREACRPEQVKNGDLESKMNIKPLENQPIYFNYQSEDEMVYAYPYFGAMC
ncbi:hypothetical protein N7474_007967, partial [Penicillium riverlandense]|uniref:uncharacterized protein n=1 Tax=Penicillium riverlandense TaxID=1903569 RepID=UPI0025478DD1